MKEENLEKHSNVTKRQAAAIIENLNLVRLSSSLGKVNFVGSYRLGLMYRPDIDLIITSANPSRSRILKLAKYFLDSKTIQTVGLADWVRHTQKGIPRGYFLELRVPAFGKLWKIDIWYKKAPSDRAIKNTARFERLLSKSPALKQRILQIKADLFDGEKYKYGVIAHDIYTAVLEKKVRDTKEFLRFKNE